MTPSPSIIAFIKRFEECRLKAYMPTPKDRPTIGWGTTGPDVKLGMVWTQAQADQRFALDLAKFSAGVNEAIGHSETSQDQFDAMVSFAYNCGTAALKSSTLLKLHKAGNPEGAAGQFGRWNKQAGVVLRGLTARRAEEAAIYRGDA